MQLGLEALERVTKMKIIYILSRIERGDDHGRESLEAFTDRTAAVSEMEADEKRAYRHFVLGKWLEPGGTNAEHYKYFIDEVTLHEGNEDEDIFFPDEEVDLSELSTNEPAVTSGGKYAYDVKAATEIGHADEDRFLGERFANWFDLLVDRLNSNAPEVRDLANMLLETDREFCAQLDTPESRAALEAYEAEIDEGAMLEELGRLVMALRPVKKEDDEVTKAVDQMLGFLKGKTPEA